MLIYETKWGEEEMKRIKGKVIEVYIPEEYKNGNLLDVMDRTNIGFRVLTEEGIKEVEEEQTEANVEIRKDDRVLIIAVSYTHLTLPTT